MSDYIVSARKYRPTSFDSVVGQSALTTTLKNAIASGKLAHAYLFCGPRGVGKTTSARIFAKTINCLSPLENGEACNECESCKAFNEQRSYNIHELDAASNNGVDDIRELIEQVQVPPQIGRYKVFIIDEVHMLTPGAFNAFLKTLEEPPAHAVFILATTEKHKILPTILSRCQIYDFNRMEVTDIVRHLKGVAAKEGITCEDEALAVIAQKADGGMRDALSIFDQVAVFSQGNITYQRVIENLNVLDYDYYFSITDSLLQCDIPKVMMTLNEILSHGFQGDHFIGGLASHFRNLLVSRDPQTLPLLETTDSVRDRYKEQAQRCKVQFLYAALRLCNDCDINYRAARNKRLLVEITLIETAQLTQEDDAVSGGHRPKKRLLPIFAPAPAQAAAVTGHRTGISSAPLRQNGNANTPAATTPAAATTQPAVTTPSYNVQQPVQQPVRRSTSYQQSRLSTVSIISHPATSPAPAVAPAAASASTTPAVAQAAQGMVQQTEPILQDELSYMWLVFANQLPVEEAAEAGRLKILKPILKENYHIEALVENELAARYLRKIAPQLTAFLRQHLHNDLLTISFPVDTSTEGHSRAFSPREVFTKLLSKNPDFATLAKILQLQPA